MDMLKTLLWCGSLILIAIGLGHAIHVAMADTIEPYMWLVSLLLIAQGMMTIVFLRRVRRRHNYCND